MGKEQAGRLNTGRNKRKNSKTASKLEKLESDIRLGFFAIIRET